MTPPFRAEHIGSLIRPQALLDAREAVAANIFTTIPPETQAVTESSIANVVKQQLAHHVTPITSGEYERHVFNAGFFEKLEGIELRDLPAPDAFRTNFFPIVYLAKQGQTIRSDCVTTGKLRREKSPYLADWLYLRSLLPQHKWKDCKITMAAITHMHSRLKPGLLWTPESGYTSDEAYFTDLATIFRDELKDLYDAGVRNVQVDDPYLTFFVTDEFRDGIRFDGDDPDELLDKYIWAHNECLTGRPKDLHAGVHLCRGNFGANHFATGSYDRIAKKLFNLLDYDTLYLEYDTERAGNFDPLKHLPVGKNVILGVVSTKGPKLESIDECVKRVYQAADVIAEGQKRSREEVLRDTLGVSPQCGFGSFSTARAMSEEQMWEKLALTRRIAQEIWGDTV